MSYKKLVLPHSLPVLLLSVCFVLVSQAAPADELIKPSQYTDFSEAQKQMHLRVSGARVAWVDFQLMRNDFPALQNLSDAQIEHWILENFAYINANQLSLRGIRSTHFDVEEKDYRDWIHPEGYRRAAVAEGVLEGKTIGLVDLKGTGHSHTLKVVEQVKHFKQAKGNPEAIQAIMTRDHSDGLASLGEVIAETTKQRAVQAAFDLRGKGEQTVENYFILDFGFDILKPNGNIPAGVVGRQAHFRGQNQTADRKVYDDPYGGFQRSISDASVDFGGVIVTYPEYQDRYSVRPGGNPGNPQDSKPWSWGHDTARAFRQLVGQNIFEARGVVYRHISEMLGSVEQRWNQIRQARWKDSNEMRIKTLLRAVAGSRGSVFRDAAFAHLEYLIQEDPIVRTGILDAINEDLASKQSEYAYAAAIGGLRLLDKGLINGQDIAPILLKFRYYPGGETISFQIFEALKKRNLLSDSPETAAFLVELVQVRRPFAQSPQTSALKLLASFQAATHPETIRAIVDSISGGSLVGKPFLELIKRIEAYKTNPDIQRVAMRSRKHYSHSDWQELTEILDPPACRILF